MKKILLTAVLIIGLGLSSLGCDSADNENGNGGEIERKVHLPDKKNIVTDNDTGLQVEKNVIHITFSQFADESRANKIIKEVGGKIVGFERDSNFYQVMIPNADLKTTKKISMKLLLEYKEVEIAVINTVSRHDNPYWNN